MEDSNLVKLKSVDAFFLRVEKTVMHSSLNSKAASFSSSFINGRIIDEKSFTNILYKLACPKKLLIAFSEVGGGRGSFSNGGHLRFVYLNPSVWNLMHEYYSLIYHEVTFFATED